MDAAGCKLFKYINSYVIINYYFCCKKKKQKQKIIHLFGGCVIVMEVLVMCRTPPSYSIWLRYWIRQASDFSQYRIEFPIQLAM